MESLAPCDEIESYILSKRTVHEARCFPLFYQRRQNFKSILLPSLLKKLKIFLAEMKIGVLSIMKMETLLYILTELAIFQKILH
ncbi:hypothetical protein CsSME_00022880 [Camellia sinensis var. sinensis]